MTPGLRVATFAAFLSPFIPVCAAQTAAAGTQTSAPATAASLAIIERYMVPVDAELAGRLDSRNAAVGQPVTAKTLETAKLADGTALPKGTTLRGHITLVQAQTQDQPYARLALVLDRAELKNGQNVALRTEIRMVAPAVNAAVSSPANMMADAQPPQVGAAGADASVGAAGPGPAGGRAGLGGNLPAGPMHPVGQTASSTLGGATPDERSLAEAAADRPGGVVNQAGETVSRAPRATGLPGIMLSMSTTVDASGTLMAAGRNIALESGTRITLAVITR